jgi:hypothetical protein
LTGDLTQSENLTVRLKPGNDHFDAYLEGNIGADSGNINLPDNGGRTTGSGNLNIQVPGASSVVTSRLTHPGGSQPGSDTVYLLVLGKILAGSTLTFANDGPGVGGRNIVRLQGEVSGSAYFFFNTSGSQGPPSVEFSQTGGLFGHEEVTMHGFTVAPAGITDHFRCRGQLAGTLIVVEQAGTSATHPSANTLDEEFSLSDDSTNGPNALVDNRPNGKGSATLNISYLQRPPGPAGTFGVIHQGSAATLASTNDPADVEIFTP